MTEADHPIVVHETHQPLTAPTASHASKGSSRLAPLLPGIGADLQLLLPPGDRLAQRDDLGPGRPYNEDMQRIPGMIRSRLSTEPLNRKTVEKVRRCEKIMMWSVIAMAPAVVSILIWDRTLGEILTALWLVLVVQLLMVVRFFRWAEGQRGVE